MLKKYIFPQLSAIYLLFCVLPHGSRAAAVDSRADSFQISHYTISLDFSNLSTKSLLGNCEIKGSSKINNLDRLSLELYKLLVDSIIQNGKRLQFKYNDSLVSILFTQKYNVGDSFELKVFYHGHPTQTSWGGFYFESSGLYAFNLGVGIATNPHNFGRAWFPCVDNFIDKSTFGFFIKSAKNNKVYCNGLLIDSVLNSDNTLTWHWEQKQPIPCYLASVAIGNYKTLYSTFSGKNGKIPVMIGVLPNDTGIAKTTFQHLPQVLKEYEGYYAPYAFSRVGFIGVNFGGGAMEHATNIALPNSAIEAGLGEESLWAHELSHHWWGDLVTCNTAADMWLNEGWASFNESMYQEKLYGAKAYQDYARTTHYSALRYAHIVDDGDRVLSPMPTDYTYGPTVYKKGADVARTLRAYLGDSLFFKGIQGYMKDFAYQSASSDDFKKVLTKYTGIDLTGFFNDWVYGAGWPHFEINYFAQSPTPIPHFQVGIAERGLNSSASYTNTPLELTTFDANWNRTVIPFIFGKTVSAPANTIFAGLNIDGKVTDATTREYKIFKAKGSYPYNGSLMTISVDSLKDSALVFVVHHWLGAERTSNSPKNIKLSTDRYWTIDGIFPVGFHAQASVNYDGRVYSSPYSGGFLDNSFLKNRSEDSLVLMYKTLYGGDWIQLKEGTDYTKTMGNNHSDAFGSIRLLTVKKGLYCLGAYDAHADLAPEKTIVDQGLEIFPNPTDSKLNVKLLNSCKILALQVYDSNGRLIKNYSDLTIQSGNHIEIDNPDLENGFYVLNVLTANGISSKKFIVEKKL